jgi:hypothetical protein
LAEFDPDFSLVEFFHSATSLLWVHTFGTYQDLNSA